MFLKGLVVAVVCGLVGRLVALNGLDVVNVSVGAALMGGVVYLIGFVTGEERAKESLLVDQPVITPNPDSHTERDPGPGFTA